jgi:glycosyltransferase involved in cell wall biosynthesis
MRVVHLGTDDYAGGAARAMFRWHISLCKLGVESKILCLNKSSDDPSVSMILPDWENQSTFEYGVLQRIFVESNRTNFSETFFSHPFGYASIADHEWIQQADVVHVHWTSLFFHWRELRRIKASGKSLVLTPHDLWPLTGGCHYPGGCDGYLKACLNCPMLREDLFQLVSKSRALKHKVISDSVDIILSPSHWMDRTFREVVGALKNVAQTVIPYCIAVERYNEKSKERTREELGFEPRRRLVLFCANNVKEERKGLAQLIGILKICEHRPELRKVLEEHVEFVLIGKGSERLQIPTAFPIHGRGYVEKSAELERYYSAADLMIYLGLEDNLPNVILEAMACGVPVLAFDTGGVGDLVVNGETGELVRSGDVANFAVQMVVLLADPTRLSWLGMNGREKVLRQFSEPAVGVKLRQLYAGLCRQPRKAIQKGPNIPEDLIFDETVQEAVRAAMVKGYRSLGQESAAAKAHVAKQEEEIRTLRGYLEQESAGAKAHVAKQEEEIRTLRGYLEQESTGAKAHVAKQEEEIRTLRGYLEQESAAATAHISKQEEEIRTLRGYLEQESAVARTHISKQEEEIRTLRGYLQQESAVARTHLSKQEEEIRALRGYLEQESAVARAHLSKQEEEIRALRGYLEQVSAAANAHISKQEEEIRTSRGYLEQLSLQNNELSANLDRERQKTLLDRFREKLVGFTKRWEK